ncbi:hypothetical protein BDK51DRAFT_42017 [Blyttiomyces helicus]|uniref:Uncharacterized protein n=1 Tax=Blyttiomyces helicus TaxID=388810 RepID=A0A4P9W1V5_9FUNG|nr:hypothetical protein BDK51DRAFT_42017 [Blyttiomyces helicus]|eukprot:RKO85345.1 hypothetical protein BDK51DRAFT_42017 [Blyttiomyces helicus]
MEVGVTIPAGRDSAGSRTGDRRGPALGASGSPKNVSAREHRGEGWMDPYWGWMDPGPYRRVRLDTWRWLALASRAELRGRRPFAPHSPSPHANM